jgi:predicted Zn-dependent protease
MNHTNITQMLNVLYGKAISTSMLRHIYLSHLYKDVPKLEQIAKTAHEMGHSVEMALEYVKHK